MRDAYAVFDLETTGFSPINDCITEIGWLVVQNGIPGPVQSRLIAIDRDVPDAAAQVTGITTVLLAAAGIPLRDALRAFLADSYGLPLVTHNGVRFDAPFLDAACLSAGLPPPAHRYYRDTAARFKGDALGLHEDQYRDHWHFATDVLSVKRVGLKYSLGHCCDQLGIPRDDVTAHRAAGDVVLTQRLYAALLGDAVAMEA